MEYEDLQHVSMQSVSAVHSRAMLETLTGTRVSGCSSYAYMHVYVLASIYLHTCKAMELATAALTHVQCVEMYAYQCTLTQLHI